MFFKNWAFCQSITFTVFFFFLVHCSTILRSLETVRVTFKHENKRFSSVWLAVWLERHCSTCHHWGPISTVDMRAGRYEGSLSVLLMSSNTWSPTYRYFSLVRFSFTNLSNSWSYSLQSAGWLTNLFQFCENVGPLWGHIHNILTCVCYRVTKQLLCYILNIVCKCNWYIVK